MSQIGAPGRTRQVPDRPTLARLLEKMTPEQIVIWCRENPPYTSPTVSTIERAMREWGLVKKDPLRPWRIKVQHNQRYPLKMLRLVRKTRNGADLTKEEQKRLDSWLGEMRRADAVVHYDPDTEQGFWYVRRRPGADKDLVRDPDADDEPAYAGEDED